MVYDINSDSAVSAPLDGHLIIKKYCIPGADTASERSLSD